MSGPNYHKTKWFSENLVALEINKTKVIINMSFMSVNSRHQQDSHVRLL